MPLPICQTEHRESSSLSYPRRALIGLTALALAAFISNWAAATLSDTRCRPDRNCCNHNPNVTGGSRTLANDKAYRHGSSATHSCSNAYVCPSTDSHSATITTGCAHAYSEPNSCPYSGADARRYA